MARAILRSLRLSGKLREKKKRKIREENSMAHPDLRILDRGVN
jgi:hypothetical protein